MTANFAQNRAAIDSKPASHTSGHPYHLRIEIDGIPKLESNGAHRSYFAKNSERRVWKMKVAAAIPPLKRPPRPLTKVKIVCTRCSSNRSDFMNRVIGFKAVVDALVDLGILIDDNDDVLAIQEFPHEKAPRGEGKIRIEIWELRE